MFLKSDTQRTLQVSSADDYLLIWLEAFLIDRKAAGVAEGTLRFYRHKIKLFTDFCETQTVKQIGQITPSFLRQYLLYLEESDHNAGGRHAAFRSLRAFMNWYETEAEPEGWSNPIHKVKGPKLPTEPLDPVSIETVARMVKTCKLGTFAGNGDKAMLFCLLDTGAGASEFLAMDLDDLNSARGTILIRQGKGSKPREVYLGKMSRNALRKYLKSRKDNDRALWVTHPRYGSGRLSYDGLREVLTRRAASAHVEVPTPHDFRRAFALAMLRNGTDVYTLAKMMGHAGITVLSRYVKQTYEDTEAAHCRAGPVDNSEFLGFV
jgi:integrase/recombinase XerD